MHTKYKLQRIFFYLLDPGDTRHLKPSFLVIGVQKGGTNSLFHYLPQHPSILPSKIKEVCFFNDGRNYLKNV